MNISPATFDQDFDALLEHRIPCGGVRGLGEGPCGDYATLVLDCHNSMHACFRDIAYNPGTFKCASCYHRWLDAITEAMAEAGGRMWCPFCECEFDRITDYARYIPL